MYGVAGMLSPNRLAALLPTPFGMLMPGRKYAAGSLYRYGFNGKENDNEVDGEGGQQDYGMRIYDPRIGRFLSVDPLSRSYPWYTPYQFAGNKPIAAVDLDGLEEEYKVKTDYRIEYKPVIKSPNAATAANNAMHNAMSFVWNATAGTITDAGKALWNTTVETVSGTYRPKSQWEINPVQAFLNWTDDVLDYFDKTPAEQQVADLVNTATNPATYELPFQLLLSRSASGNAVRITGANSAQNSVRVRLANSAEANAEYTMKGFYAPYNPGTTLAEFETPAKLENLVRLSGPNNVKGDWFTTMEEIKGLTPSQLKDKFSLKYEPTFATPVSMAQGSTIRIGTAAPIKEFSTKGGGFQIELKQGEAQFGTPSKISN